MTLSSAFTQALAALSTSRHDRSVSFRMKKEHRLKIASTE
jgi:hypothetical protein